MNSRTIPRHRRIIYTAICIGGSLFIAIAIIAALISLGGDEIAILVFAAAIAGAIVAGIMWLVSVLARVMARAAIFLVWLLGTGIAVSMPFASGEWALGVIAALVAGAVGGLLCLPLLPYAGLFEGAKISIEPRPAGPSPPRRTPQSASPGAGSDEDEDE